MANISKIEVDGVTYDIEDSTARTSGGFSDTAKQALLSCFQNVAWINQNGQSLYNALESALYNAELISISAVFTQGNRTIFSNAELDSLKEYLVVTANYSDGNSQVLGKNAYGLTGQLTAGTSVVTVSYGGKTATFNVTVTAFVIPNGYTRYGYIQKKDTTTTNVPRDKFIILNSYTDLDELSIEIIVGQRSSTGANPAFLGARMGSSAVGTSVAIYNDQTNGFRLYSRGKIILRSDFITSKTKLEFINPATSPAYWRINDGELNSETWSTEEAPVVTCPIMLFNNAPYADTTTAYTINPQAQLGDLILRKADGECVGYYVPATYNGVIGMYDVVSETFYTAETTTVVTIANSGCLYAVGTWA